MDVEESLLAQSSESYDPSINHLVRMGTEAHSTALVTFTSMIESWNGITERDYELMPTGSKTVRGNSGRFKRADCA